MNIKHLFFCMLLIAFSSCSKPGYEKAIAEWIQTDSHGTWTDLKFELLEVLETEDVTVSDSLRYLNNKSAQLSTVTVLVHGFCGLRCFQTFLGFHIGGEGRFE